jgi:DNA-directed RNA polymerase specialized sigma24 family protein
MGASVVRLTRRQWASIPDPGPRQIEEWRWVDLEELREAIGLLEPRITEVLRLSCDEGLCWSEISERLKVPVGVVAGRFMRGRRQLRSILHERLPPWLRDAAPNRLR